MANQLDSQHQFVDANGDLFLSLEDDIYRFKDMGERVEQIKTLFNGFAENVDCCYLGVPDAFRVKYAFEGSETTLVLGVDAVTPPGNSRSNSEYRVQPRGKQIRYVFEGGKEAADNFWLCFYKREDLFLCCAWKSKWSDSDESNALYKIDAKTLAQAQKYGFSRELRNRKMTAVCAFKPNLLPFFLKNRELLLSTPSEERLACSNPNNRRDTKKWPSNLIFFGAPGTGKSHELSKIAESSFLESNVSRVTFYPDYTYSQFVGCFKPTTKPNNKQSISNEDESLDTSGSCVSYEFVPGPFLLTYMKAVQHPDKNYLLIVEEINRANTAAVFGDVFQLLDRDDDGSSTYTVATSEEMADCIGACFNGLSDDEKTVIEHYYDDVGFEDIREMSTKNLCLPPNMYIWATMNSADQGVFPMDTAFKRRWDFRYIDIDEGENADIGGTPLSEIEVPCGGRNVLWNDLRHAINEFLMSDEMKVNEDKLLGPFFISPTALKPDRFPAVFKDKVLLYLYEDVGKTKRKKLFRDGLNTYSKVCAAFDVEGEGIFGAGFDGSRISSRDNSEVQSDIAE